MTEFEDWFRENYGNPRAVESEYRQSRKTWNAALDLAAKQARVELSHGEDWFPDYLESFKETDDKRRTTK